AKLQFGFFGIYFRDGIPVVVEITVLINEARHFVFRNDRTPAVIDALAGERQMKAKISSGMRFGIVCDFWEPRARHHETGGIDEAGFKSLDGCGVYGMRYANIIGMDNQNFCVAREAQFFRERFGIDLRVRFWE